MIYFKQLFGIQKRVQIRVIPVNRLGITLRQSINTIFFLINSLLNTLIMLINKIDYNEFFITFPYYSHPVLG